MADSSRRGYPPWSVVLDPSHLFIAAVLVNVSYYVCAIAVDVSNILGGSLQDLLMNLRKTVVSGTSVDIPQFNIVTTSILSGSAVGLGAWATISAAGGLTALLWMLVPVLAMALLSVFIAVLVLAARQALIIILIMVSPLAFVAYLLPNTSKWFDKWRDLFVTLLVMFPLMSILFGGSQLAASVIMNNADDMLLVLLALTVQVIPLAITPFIIKLSGGVLGRFAGMVNNPSKGPVDRVKKWAGERGELATKRSLSRDSTGLSWMRRAGQGRDQRDRRRKLDSQVYDHALDSRWNEHLATTDPAQLGRRGDSAAVQESYRRVVIEAEDKEIKSAMQALARELSQVRAAGGNPDAHLEARASDPTRTHFEQRAAMHEAARLGRDGVMRNLQAANAGNPEVLGHLQDAIGANTSSLIGKAPDLIKGADAAFNSVTGEDLTSFSDHTMRAYVDHMATQIAAGNTAAAASFDSAVADIQADTRLQSKLDGAAGQALAAAGAAASGASALVAAQIGASLGAIGADGKIR